MMASGLYSKTIHCPVCKTEFETCKIKTSALRMTHRDTDMCPYYGDINPLLYQIIVCPRCGYANFESKYNSILKHHIDRLDGIADIWNPRDFGGERELDEAIETYKLALLCLNRMEYSSLDIGKICLRLAWLYRYKDNINEEIRFLDYTIENFTRAYSNEFIDEDEELIVLYILGEINRRRKHFNQAIVWFDKVLKHRDIRRKRHIAIRTREQWSLCREENKRYKNIG